MSDKEIVEIDKEVVDAEILPSVEVEAEVVSVKTKKTLPKFLKIVPALAFVLGFFWNSFTMETVVSRSDLWVLAAYYFVAFALLLIGSLNINLTFRSAMAWGAQFGFGALFNGLAAFNFNSLGYILVGVLFILIVLFLLFSEVLRNKITYLLLNWILFTLSGVMLFNFLIPYSLGSAGGLWFVLSSLLAFVFTYILWKVSRQNIVLLLFPMALVVSFIAVYFAELTPPIPMVLNKNIVCKNYEKVDGDFTCMEPQQSFKQKAGFSDFVIHSSAGQVVYVLSSVLGPQGASAELEHRWLAYDSTSGV